MMAEIAAHVQACIKQAGLTGPELVGSNPIEPHLAAFLQRSDVSVACVIWDRILQHSITLCGPLGERTLEVMRSMLRKLAPLLFVHGTLTVLDALKEDYGLVQPDYMLGASENAMYSLFGHERAGYRGTGTWGCHKTQERS